MVDERVRIMCSVVASRGKTNVGYIFAIATELIDGAVGLISIHLAFYQMNPWPTALAAFSIFGTHTSSTPVGIFCFLLFLRHASKTKQCLETRTSGNFN